METKNCPKCNQNKSFSEFHTKGKEKRLNSWCKVCVYEKQKIRWRDRKRKAVELLGGKCCKCGYDKNLACLDFHHLDPEQKDMDWNKLRLHKWNTIVLELKKCILLCRNCHGETHWPDQFLTRENQEANNLLDYNHKVLEPTGKCPFCGKDVYSTKYCSVECVAQDRRKVKDRPTKEELSEMLKTMSYCSIGRHYNVSDNAVRKWAKKYDL